MPDRARLLRRRDERGRRAAAGRDVSADREERRASGDRTGTCKAHRGAQARGGAGRSECREAGEGPTAARGSVRDHPARRSREQACRRRETRPGSNRGRPRADRAGADTAPVAAREAAALQPRLRGSPCRPLHRQPRHRRPSASRRQPSRRRPQTSRPYGWQLRRLPRPRRSPRLPQRRQRRPCPSHRSRPCQPCRVSRNPRSRPKPRARRSGIAVLACGTNSDRLRHRSQPRLLEPTPAPPPPVRRSSRLRRLCLRRPETEWRQPSGHGAGDDSHPALPSCRRPQSCRRRRWPGRQWLRRRAAPMAAPMTRRHVAPPSPPAPIRLKSEPAPSGSRTTRPSGSPRSARAARALIYSRAVRRGGSACTERSHRSQAGGRRHHRHGVGVATGRALPASH